MIIAWGCPTRWAEAIFWYYLIFHPQTRTQIFQWHYRKEFSNCVQLASLMTGSTLSTWLTGWLSDLTDLIWLSGLIEIFTLLISGAIDTLVLYLYCTACCCSCSRWLIVAWNSNPVCFRKHCQKPYLEIQTLLNSYSKLFSLFAIWIVHTQFP